MNTHRSTQTNPRRHPGSNRSAFTLLEVVIAVVILGLAMLTILEGLSTSLNAVESIRNTNTATELLGIKLAELQQQDTLDTGTTDGDFEEAHPGFKWATDIELSDLPDLYDVKITVSWVERGQPASDAISTYLYRAGQGPQDLSAITRKLGAPQVQPHR